MFLNILCLEKISKFLIVWRNDFITAYLFSRRKVGGRRRRAVDDSREPLPASVENMSLARVISQKIYIPLWDAQSAAGSAFSWIYFDEQTGPWKHTIVRLRRAQYLNIAVLQSQERMHHQGSSSTA